MASHLIGLSNGAIVNDLERPQAQISRSRHYLALNISETVRNINIVRPNIYMDFRASQECHFQ